MALFFAVHTLKKSSDEIHEIWSEFVFETASAMAAGETPAKCIKAWNPLPHGRTGSMFCLWEADKPEDIETTLGKWLDCLTDENVKVD